MTGHSVSWAIVPNGIIVGNVECYAPEDSPCEPKLIDGSNACRVTDYMDALTEGIELAYLGDPAPLRSAPITVVRDDDGYTWTYAEEVS